MSLGVVWVPAGGGGLDARRIPLVRVDVVQVCDGGVLLVGEWSELVDGGPVEPVDGEPVDGGPVEPVDGEPVDGGPVGPVDGEPAAPVTDEDDEEEWWTDDDAPDERAPDEEEGWAIDPTGRHLWRWKERGAWTDVVLTRDGEEAYDPYQPPTGS